MCADVIQRAALNLLYLPGEPDPAAAEPCPTSRSEHLAKNARKTATRKNVIHQTSPTRQRAAGLKSPSRKNRKAAPAAGAQIEYTEDGNVIAVEAGPIDDKLVAFADDEADGDLDAADEVVIEDEIEEVAS